MKISSNYFPRQSAIHTAQAQRSHSANAAAQNSRADAEEMLRKLIEEKHGLATAALQDSASVLGNNLDLKV